MDIIGGPAIRRTERKATYIWLVIDEKPDRISITVSTNENLSNPIAVSNSAPSNIVKLGDKLFNCLIKVNPATGSFPADCKLYYDINIDGQSLADFDLLSGKKSIVYGNDSYPSFILPTKHTNILQGSCRKPHASNRSRHSQYDHMRTANSLLNASINNTNTRPTMLCLTGDQIYADDVVLPLLCGLKEKSKYYLGWDEELPDSKDNKKTIIPDQIKLTKRDKILTKTIGFSSGKKENHLMGFGEYMMMYLAVWGGVSLTIPSYSSIVNEIPTKRKRRRTGKGTYIEPAIREYEYEEQRSIVISFLANAATTRRVMANITSYMMFDDHEITDDWNLTEKNYKQFRTNRLSKRIQANGLAAYWACQGWGNNPSLSTTQFKSVVSKFLTSKTSKSGSKYETTLNSQRWNYTVEGFPALVALDTRTRRSYKGGTFSQLMSASEMSLLKKEFDRINKLYQDSRDEQSVLLLSPAPFLGFTLAERIQLALNFLPTSIDGEPWIGNETAYKRMKNALSKLEFKQCCIISGDVHYSFSRCMHIPRKSMIDLEVLQVTSSSLHNAPTGILRLLLHGFTLAEKSIFNRNKTPYLYPDNETEFINGHTNISHLQYNLGQPVKNSVTFFDPNEGKPYKWVYNFEDPHIVHFS